MSRSQVNVMGRRCGRWFFPNQARDRFRCPALIPDDRGSLALYCSITRKRTVAEGRKKGWVSK